MQDHVIVVGDIFHFKLGAFLDVLYSHDPHQHVLLVIQEEPLTLELADRISGPASRSLPPKSACTHITYYIY